MSRTLVTAHNITKTFEQEDKRITVLRGVTLSLDRGEMVCVVGPSGAGKSTLLHLLGTLDLPTSGQILFQGQDLTRLSSAELAAFRNRSLGFVFQFHHLLPEFDALENVMMPGLVQGMSRSKLQSKARELLHLVGLDKRGHHRPGELSGGEQQRVALARALVLDPSLVLADEPTGNLDSATSAQVEELFFEINRTRGTTFLIVTHSLHLASRMPRVIHMKDGAVVRDERRSDAPEPSVAEPSLNGAEPSQNGAEPSQDSAEPSQDGAEPSQDSAEPSQE